MSNISKSWISLENYEKLEKFSKKFKSSELRSCVIIDDEDRIGDNKVSLERYMEHQFDHISFHILDISDLPKSTKMCLILKKDECI